MKQLSPALQAHLESGATTLCWCWRLARADGVVQGFTDHDKPLAFDGVTYEAATGFTASDIKDGVGLSVDNLEVSGALSSAALNEADLAAGRYDDARIQIYRVNWQDVSQRVLMRTGSLGEVRRTGVSFTAEVRGLAHYLQQPKGRLFQYTCDADLGDQRCGVTVALPAYRASGVITAVQSARRLTVSGLDGFAHDFFSRGLLRFTSGAAAASSIEIKAHSRSGGVTSLELWAAAEGPPAVGDAIIATAGCDKRFATCKAKFANSANFRGFPSMPGNEFLTKVGRSG
ncbi:MAG: DUF2163 domain-containing protein [Hyphomonadaceae bacterium]|nr:DUF2163 domain-containing protein [Hyphomicrobium sp.]MBX9746477.1 DUF2163 domain-containing protein [Hyphomonadaceae bacterium]